MRSTCRSDGSPSNLNVIILRWNKARGEIVDDLRATTEDSSESSFWIDDHIKRVFKKLVHSFMDAENQLYGLQIREKRLESFKSDGKVPSGLKINVVAKGQRAQSLHEKFSIITKETEIKLLEATIEALNNEEQQANERCKEEKKNIDTAIESWRESFQTSASSLEVEADEFVQSAKCFADSFYFECAATRASKRVSETIKKVTKETKRTDKMETEFSSDEQSIRDMVNRAVQKEVSKLSSVSSTGKTKQPPRKRSKRHGKERANSKNRNQRRRDASQDGRTSAVPVAKQERQCRSRQRRRSRVSFSDDMVARLLVLVQASLRVALPSSEEKGL